MQVSCAWLYAITRYGYPPSFENIKRVYREISDMGFRYAELEAVGRDNLEQLQKGQGQIASLIRNLGLSLVNMVPVFPELVSLDERRRKAALDLFRASADLAAGFGCRTLQLDSYFPPVPTKTGVPYEDAIKFGVEVQVGYDPSFSWSAFWSVLVDTVGQCSEIARERGMRLCVEPRIGENISNCDAMLRLIEHVKSPNLGMVFDAGHLHAAKEILPLSMMKMGDRIFYVHVADNDSTHNHHRALGDGSIDWDTFFETLRGIGYDGFVGIDVGDVPDIIAATTASREKAEGILRRLATPGSDRSG